MKKIMSQKISMAGLLRAEYRKTRGRYLFLTVLGLTLVELLWMLGGKLNEDAIKKGWMMMIYEQPLINALFFPVLLIVISTRLGDLEHKNSMLKELCCIVERENIFDAKFLYGGFLMLISILIQFVSMACWGFIKGFGGSMPIKEYIFLFFFTLVPTLVLYIIQHTLALCCKKPLIPFIVGIIGEFIGVLSLFLPQVPLLRKIIPWGYYGALMFVGMDYDRTTRIADYYYIDIDWTMFFAMLALSAVLYFAGRKVFCHIEL